MLILCFVFKEGFAALYQFFAFVYFLRENKKMGRKGGRRTRGRKVEPKGGKRERGRVFR